MGAAVPRAYALGYYLSPLPGLVRLTSMRSSLVNE
ncbi:hypothetical protein SBA2_10002 [Acidobacteriia bacterium SbA2]|nr:hypothetical protein SBA2_10002 [Acidobacteriia bacterium SbA2]